MKKFWREFKEFINKGNVLGLAVMQICCANPHPMSVTITVWAQTRLRRPSCPSSWEA